MYLVYLVWYRSIGGMGGEAKTSKQASVMKDDRRKERTTAKGASCKPYSVPRQARDETRRDSGG